jgi:hypothetical protein
MPRVDVSLVLGLEGGERGNRERVLLNSTTGTKKRIQNLLSVSTPVPTHILPGAISQSAIVAPVTLDFS